MTTDHNSPCELILKIGCNEYDEISTAINTLLRSCSISDQSFFCVERQIQSTTYFNSFTNQLSTTKLPIQCQSLSCVILLPNNTLKQQENKDFFKSIHIWNFHHKIELLDECQQITARQDYYELSHLLPLWSISHIPYTQQIIIRFNVFTKNFDFMLRFYEDLFQRKPHSSKSGFALFNLSTSMNKKLLYQFSIKYSPSIESYAISQGAYLKFHLHNLNDFIHEYVSKLFTINKFEYYIYDPDGNLLHLYLNNKSFNQKESIPSKSLIHTNDSGVGDSSDPSMQQFNSPIDNQSHSSNDSGQCSSISSNELNPTKQPIYPNCIPAMNNISVRSAKKSEIDYRLKQQQWKSAVYESEPRLSNIISYNNRYYSSMNNVRKLKKIPTYDISYAVDSPPNSSSFGYLNAFLLKKQQSNHSHHVKQLINRFERPIQDTSSRLRSKSVTADRQNSTNDAFNQKQSSRINIGITLDSRLRKTPVLDMLRSTTMQSHVIEPSRLNRTSSLKHSFIPIARF